ncbi:MAG: hypothetical protein Kow0063_31860 [Anaerolineae bacterium]
MENREKANNHWPFAILIAVFCLLAASFSLLLPLNEAVDEESHFDLIRFIAEHKRFPMTNQERLSLGDKGDASPIYHGLVAVLSQHVDITPLPQRHFISPDKQAIPYDTILTTQDLHTEDELFPFRGIVLSWHLARLVSIPLSALTIVAIYLISLAIFPQRTYFALTVAAFAFVPRFVFNSAVINDDNLVIPLVAFAIYYQVRIIQGDQRIRAFVVLGALAGLAVITKYHSLVLLPEITFAFFILAWRHRAVWKGWLKRWAWVMLSFVVTTGWWFFFLFSRFNRVAELGLLGGLLAPLGDPTTTEVTGLRPGSLSVKWDWIAPVFRSFWVIARSSDISGLGPVYLVLIVLTGVAVLGVFWLTYKCVSSHQPGKWRLDIALLGLHFLFYLAIVFGRYQVFVARGTPPPAHSTQGRHLYPALISIAFFYVLGWRAVLGELPLRKSIRVARLGDLVLASIVSLGLLTLSTANFFFIVRPGYLPHLPVVTLKPDEVAISYRMDVDFVEGLSFVGYNLKTPKRTGYVLPVHLFWQAKTSHERDYVAQLCIHDAEGSIISCHWGHPGDGLYPTRAWDAGYLIRDERILPLPPCLVAGEYELTLSVWPLRNDVASALIDEAIPVPRVHSLGLVTLAPVPQPAYHGVYLCTVDGCYIEGQVTLSQIRQTVTVVSYQRDPVSQAGDTTVRFVLDNAGTASPAQWLPFQNNAIYHCPDGQTFQTFTFIVDQSVVPGLYTLEMNGRLEEAFSINVGTHPRNFKSPPDPERSLSISFGNQFDLLGYDVDLSPRWPDDTIEVITYWQTRQKTAHNYNAALHLLDNTLTTRQLHDKFLGGLYPNTLWAPGEFTQDRHILQGSDQTLLPGLYTLELRLYSYSQGRFEPLPMVDTETNQPIQSNPVLGQVRIMDPARMRPPEHARIIEMGHEIRLLGYDLADTQVRPGESISLALHWEAITRLSTDYTVFTQLIGPDGLVWGQQDNQPQHGRYPTTAWLVKDRVVDRYDILVREDAPQGTYSLLAGMYDLATGERLPAFDEQEHRLPDDAVILSTIEVVRKP